MSDIIVEDTLRLHRDADYKGKNQAINPVTSKKPQCRSDCVVW